MIKTLLMIVAMLMLGEAASAQTLMGNCNGTVGVITQPTGVGGVYCTPVTTQYTVAVSALPSADGTVSGGGTFAAGSSRTVTATPKSGFSFVRWTQNGSAVSSSSSYTFTLTGNITLVANFTPVTTPPTVLLSAAPMLITSGQSSTLTWSSMNATSCSASGNWNGSEPISGSLVVSPPATASYSLTCTGSGSATASATVTVNPLVSGNCGMQLGGVVTFCETFDAPAGVAGTRSGDLDPNVWGVSRATGGGVNFGQAAYNTWNATTILKCDGSSPMVSAPGDIIICNGQLREAVNDNPTGGFDDGDVTSLAMYPKQPFDFAGRTGTVSFDVSNDSAGGHSAWPEFWMSDLPVPDPFNHFDSWQSLPANGFSIRFSGVAPAGDGGLCPNSNNIGLPRWTVDGATVIRGYVLEDVDYQGVDFGTASNPPLKLNILDCVTSSSGPGNMNHVEVRVNQTEIDVYATDAGVVASPATLRKIASLTNANVTFTRGLVWLEDAHYNADKGTNNSFPVSQKEHTFSWDNLAFDGPFTYRDFSYDAPDDGTPYTNDNYLPGAQNLGKYSRPNQTSSWSVVGLPANPKAAAARVLFNFNPGGGSNPTILNVIVNGHAHVVPWPYPDNNAYDWRTYAVTVPLTDLVPGVNVVQLGGDVDLVYSNVDIVLGNVTGGVPVLPGSNNAYPGG
jgi:hypothetical protein